MQLDPTDRDSQYGAHRARAAAQVDDDGVRPGKGGGLVHQELGAPPRYEHIRVDKYPQPAEVCPAEDVFERYAGDPLINHRREFGRCGGRADEQLRFVLGEDAAGSPKPCGDDRYTR